MRWIGLTIWATFLAVGVLPLVTGAVSGASETINVVGVRASRKTTVEEMAGVSLVEYIRLRTNYLALGDFEKLLKQTERARVMRQYSGTDLRSLTASIMTNEVSLYEGMVKREMAFSLIAELVLKREPAAVWYYDPKKLRNCIEYTSHLWSDETRLWIAAAGGLPEPEFAAGFREAYRSHPPTGLDRNSIEGLIESAVRRMREMRAERKLDFWNTARRLSEPRIPAHGNREAFVQARWLQAEVFNWWTHCIVKWLAHRPSGVELEQVIRPRLTRDLVIARVEREEDLQPIERFIGSLKELPGGGGLDWEIYRQAVGFGNEFGFTNRHLVRFAVTNGGLVNLFAENQFGPRVQLSLPHRPVPGEFWHNIFIPLMVRDTNGPKPAWTPVELTHKAWARLEARGGLKGFDPKRVRVWLSEERRHGIGRWDFDAASVIREQTLKKLIEEEIRPRLERLMGEFEYKNPAYFPSVANVMAILEVWQSFEFSCDLTGDPVRVLQEPIPR